MSIFGCFLNSKRARWKDYCSSRCHRSQNYCHCWSDAFEEVFIFEHNMFHNVLLQNLNLRCYYIISFTQLSYGKVNNHINNKFRITFLCFHLFFQVESKNRRVFSRVLRERGRMGERWGTQGYRDTKPHICVHFSLLSLLLNIRKHEHWKWNRK